MKNFVLLSSVLAVSFLFAGCESESRDDTSMTDDSMEGMDHSMMGHDMSTMMIQSDEDFVSMMIPHHQEAVDTAEVILEKSDNADLKAMAQDIVDSQTAEIAQMEAWGKEWFGTSFKASDDYEAMMPDLSTLEGEALDQAFIAGMIKHHEMAIQMAQEVKMVTMRSELLTMANAIIEAQTKEVTLLKSWLK